jgi:hypothetical protein
MISIAEAIRAAIVSDARPADRRQIRTPVSPEFD